MIITITGRMGTGKNTFIKLLPTPIDYIVVDADVIGHEILTRDYVIKKISHVFPNVIEEGMVNRKKLAESVFPDKIQQLNSIVHPYLIEEVHSNLRPNMIIHSALPKELKLIGLSDLVITIDSSDKVIEERLKEKFSKEDILNRLKAQNTKEWYKSIADIVIENNGTLEELQQEIAKKCKNLF